MATFSFKIITAKEGRPPIGGPNGALVISSFEEGEETVVLRLPVEMASRIRYCRVRTEDVDVVEKLVTYDASGSFTIETVE